MASCDGDCSSFTASDGTWFKIDQGGYTNGQWASDELIASTSDCFRHSEQHINIPRFAMQMAINGLPPFPLGSLLANTSVNSVALMPQLDRTDVPSLVGSL